MENCLDGLIFVITGVLESIEREEAADLIQRYGGNFIQSVSKKTGYVVVGRDPGEHKFFKVHWLRYTDQKRKKKKQKHEHQHIGCTFSPKFLQQMWGAAYCKSTRETCHKFA